MSSSGPEERPELGRPTPLGVKVLWAAIGAVVLVLVLQVAFALRGSDESDVVTPRTGELSVSDAIGSSPAGPVAVRGFVFLREGFPPRLCSGREGDDPRRCVGPFLDLTGLDESRLDLRRGRDGGRAVAWVDDPVAVLGTVNGSAMTVTEILS